ncbi:MAG: iron-containing redox enzyme family protein [Leptolyngbyaceae cyanobacterium MAG.088]|nr:iron-containing redox enzyme family protein [Leptolyngbyaceae cyanobacterium MAG.088]
MHSLKQLPHVPLLTGEAIGTSIYHNLTLNDLVHLPSLDDAVTQVASHYNFQRHPYICWMQQQTTDREAFCQSQIPFRFAVESFSQALAAVLARMPLLEERLPLANNVAEEHGYGDRHRSHKCTFHQYLNALGANHDDFNAPCPVPVLAFNQSILTYALSQPGENGAALLGIIEYVYVDISATIARTLQQRQWTAPDSQSHYAAHETLDVEHARELLTLAKPAWHSDHARPHIAQGLLLGAYYFWRLYDALLPTL